MASDIYIYAGERFREARERRGLTRQQVADRLGVHFTSITNYERGRKVSFDMFLKVCAALQLDPVDVVAGIMRDVPDVLEA